MLIGLAFRDVAFQGRTFSAALYTAGTNGLLPPEGAPLLPFKDIRIDPGASAWQFEPWAQVVHRAFAARGPGLWNPYQGAGAPLAANMQSAVFDPYLLAVHLHPSLIVWDLTFLVSMVVGAWLSFIYFRSLEVGTAGSITGAAVFGLSGFFFMYSNDQFFRAYLLIPPLLLLVDRVIQRGRLRWIALLAAVAASNVYIGMPESSVGVLGLTAGYALARLVTIARPRRDRLLAVVRLGAALLLTLCLAAPLVLIFLQYASASFTQHPPGGEVGLRAEPARLIILWLAPRANGPLMTNVSVTRNWIGAGALLLGIFALSSWTELRRRPVGFFALAAGLVILKAYDFPFIQFVGKLPVASQTNFPGFVLPVCGFCFAGLAASGVQAIADRSWRAPALAAALVIAGLGAALLINSDLPTLATVPWSSLLKSFGLAAAALAAVLVAGLALPPAVARWAVAGAVVVELLLLTPHGFYAPRIDPYRPPPWLAAVGYGRTPSADRLFALEAKLFPDTAGVFGLQDIRALDALYPTRYVRYITTFLQPDFGSRFVGGAYSQPEGRMQPSIVDNPMADALGVKYIVSGQSLPDEPFITAVFRDRAVEPGLHPALFDLAGDRRPVLFEVPGRRAVVPVDTPNPRLLRFSYGMDPAAFADTGDDGVVFVVDAVAADSKRTRLWSASYVPRTNPVAPAFRDVDVAIPPEVGARLAAIWLTVEARGNTRTDEAGWADVQVLSASQASAAPGALRMIAATEQTTVYENPAALPRAFVAPRISYAADTARAVHLLSDGEPRFATGAVHVTRFDPRRDAVVEGPGSPQPSRCGTALDRSSITSYQPEEVTIDVQAPCPGMLILTDTYYPGWEASVNGHPAVVRPTDVLFRGVAVDRGHSVVVFRYRPAAFYLGLGIAAVGVLVIILCWALRWANERYELANPRPRRASAPGLSDKPRGDRHE